MIKPDIDSAQIKVPPPFVVLWLITLAYLIKVYFPFPVISEEYRWPVGLCLIVSAVFLMFSCVRLFKKNKTHIEPWKPTKNIMIEGPYRFTRNPIYLSFMMMVLGAVVMMNNLYSFLVLVPLFIFLNFYVISNEEKYLSAKFGEIYLEYLKSKRRWL